MSVIPGSRLTGNQKALIRYWLDPVFSGRDKDLRISDDHLTRMGLCARTQAGALPFVQPSMRLGRYNVTRAALIEALHARWGNEITDILLELEE